MSSPDLRFAIGMVRLTMGRLRVLSTHIRTVLEEMEDLANDPEQQWEEWGEQFSWLVGHQIEWLCNAAWLVGARAYLQAHLLAQHQGGHEGGQP